MANSTTPAILSRNIPTRRRRLIWLLMLMSVLAGVLIFQRSQRRPLPAAVPRVSLDQLLFPSTEATLRLRDTLHSQPNNAKGHLELGVALAEQGFFMAALHEYRAAMNQGMQTADAHRALAQDYER